MAKGYYMDEDSWETIDDKIKKASVIIGKKDIAKKDQI